MNNYPKILLIEPSDIISRGFETILSKFNQTIEFSYCRCLSDSDTLSFNHNAHWDIVIINPVVINRCPNLQKNLIKRFHKSVLLALLTNVYDRTFCDIFQDCIYLNDDENSIHKLIAKYIHLKHNGFLDNSVLTEREIEILQLLVRGESIKEIADKLNISNHTALSHRRNISDKLGIKSVAALAIYAVATKIINPNDMRELR
jgi:two-component system, NarL family, response regulator NreC